jgi:hypothetical protein
VTAPPAAPDALYRRESGLIVPSGHTRGPWHPDQQHGGAPAALLAQAVATAGDGDAETMVVARLTYEFLGPVPIAPLRVSAEVVKPGKRFQLVAGELSDADGRVLMRVRAVRLRRGGVGLPEAAKAPPGNPYGSTPENARPLPSIVDGEWYGHTGNEVRFADGSYGEPGPGRAWFRIALPLIGDEPPLPVARAASAADFGNGISNVLGFDTHLFVNTDLTVHLLREPVGEWVMLDSRTEVDGAGVGLASSRLYDERGPIGLSAQTLFVAER